MTKLQISVKKLVPQANQGLCLAVNAHEANGLSELGSLAGTRYRPFDRNTHTRLLEPARSGAKFGVPSCTRSCYAIVRFLSRKQGVVTFAGMGVLCDFEASSGVDGTLG
jgi:hypothetical protein